MYETSELSETQNYAYWYTLFSLGRMIFKAGVQRTHVFLVGMRLKFSS